MHVPIIGKIASAQTFRQELIDLLVKICSCDTSIRSEVDVLRQAEHEVFEILEEQIRIYCIPGLTVQRCPINAKITSHPFFSHLYYTQNNSHPKGLTCEKAYTDRSNLLVCIDGNARDKRGVNQAINAHIDVVAPYFGPRVDGTRVYGRGTCDDKGSVVAIIGALKLVGAYLAQDGRPLNKHLTCMIVIDEEMGGNGSLSAAIDRDLKKRYDSLVVMEACSSKIYPGNRGAVWYKIEAKAPGVNLFEASAYVIEEMEKEGRSIRAESDHPLFPDRPVQTCHGIIGHVGEHPSAINGDVSFNIVVEGNNPTAPKGTINDVIDFALAEYTSIYGDKTKRVDPHTSRPRVDHHVEISKVAHGYTVRVLGSPGHMGSILENDGAITKMATIVRSLIRSRAALERAADGPVAFHLEGWQDPAHLLMEGGQGFVPTHEMADIQSRLRTAVQRGAAYYLRLSGHDPAVAMHFQITFDKLHNAAFGGDSDSPDMRHALECAKKADLWTQEAYAQGICGFNVSCDARIFACEYPDLPVLTTGPGSLKVAHSDQEHIQVDEMVKAAEFLAYYILKQTGTVV